MLGRAAPVALLSLALGAVPMGGAATDVHAIDTRKSSAVFIVPLRGRASVEGRMPRPSGEVAGSAEAGWTVRVKVDGRGLRVDGPQWMERVTRSDSFLAVNRHPQIRFESAAFDDEILKRGGEISGHLTLRGLRRPVSLLLLPSDCARPGLDCELQVHGRVSRKAFGMNAYRTLVRDEVEVRFHMRLRESAR